MRGKMALMGLLASLVLLGGTACWATPDADDLIRMAKSGVDEEVLMAYIKAAPDTFDLSADDIISLKDLGVPSKVICEAMLHGHTTDTSLVAAAKEEIQQATSDTAAAAAAEAPAAEASAEAPAETAEVSTSAAIAPPSDYQNISFFYAALYPYGNWLNISGQWCWQPTAETVNPDWTPYCRHGHWVWSDWGWCWESDYSWGWAPFHYGRWFRDPQNGWCWVPDAEWGPAWVAWRTGDDYCGWAPLPPGSRYDQDGFYFHNSRVEAGFDFGLTSRDFFFLPKGNFCDPHPWVHIVPAARAGDAFNRTDFQKDAYRFDNGHVFNGGPHIDDISRATHREIQPITIQENAVRPGKAIPRGQLRGDHLVIYKPAIASTAPFSPTVIKAEFAKRSVGGLLVQTSTKIKNHVQRQNDAWHQALKIQQANASSAAQRQSALQQQARSEPDPQKSASIKAEADVQSMREQNATTHASHIKSWNPPAENAPVIIPRSRVIASDQTPERSNKIVRQQVRSEAVREDQQSRNAENMVRTVRAAPVQQQLREQPREQPRAQPQQQQNRGGGDGGGGGRR